jgi:hypothetical protein
MKFRSETDLSTKDRRNIERWRESVCGRLFAFADRLTPMAKPEHDADREQKPVTKSLSIEIQQGQKTKLLRALVSTADELWMRMSVRRSRERRRPARDPITAVARDLWPDTQGRPPETLSRREALKLLGDELDRRGMGTSVDSQRRAIGRRGNSD